MLIKRGFMVLGVWLVGLVLMACATQSPAPSTKSAPAPASTPAPVTTTTQAAPTTTAKPAPAPSPAAQSAADFYKNNPVTMWVPSSPGGGTDFSARLFASYWSEYTGGHMAVLNKTGAGGLSGVNGAYAAKPDGLTLITVHHPADVVNPWLFKEPGVQFDPTKMNWVGFFGACPNFTVVGKERPYNSLEDLQKAKGLKFGASGPKTSDSALTSAFVASVANIDIRTIVIFDSANEVSLSTFRGEIEGYSMQANAINTHFNQGWIKPPLIVLGTSKSQWFPKAPALTEVLKLTPDQEKILTVLLSSIAGKSIFGPPGIPADRVQFLRDVFDKMMTNKGFLQQAAYVFPIWEKPVSGKDILARINTAAAITEADKAKLLEIGKKYTG